MLEWHVAGVPLCVAFWFEALGVALSGLFFLVVAAAAAAAAAAIKNLRCPGVGPVWVERLEETDHHQPCWA